MSPSPPPLQKNKLRNFARFFDSFSQIERQRPAKYQNCSSSIVKNFKLPTKLKSYLLNLWNHNFRSRDVLFAEKQVIPPPRPIHHYPVFDAFSLNARNYRGKWQSKGLIWNKFTVLTKWVDKLSNWLKYNFRNPGFCIPESNEIYPFSENFRFII